MIDPSQGDIEASFDSLLAAPPSEPAWRALTALLDRCPAALLEGAVARALPALEAWPDALRRAPGAWVDALLEGRPGPGLALCRTLIVVGRRLSAAELSALAAHPLLADLTDLRLFDVGLDDALASAFASACSLPLYEVIAGSQVTVPGIVWSARHQGVLQAGAVV